MSTAAPGARRATTLLLWALGVLFGSRILLELGRKVLVEYAFSGHSYSSLFEILYQLERGAVIIATVALLLCAVGSWRLRDVDADARTRGLLAASSLCAAVMAAACGALILSSVLAPQLVPPVMWKLVIGALLGAELFAWPLLALAATRRLDAHGHEARGHAPAVLVTLAVAWYAGIPLVGTVFELRLDPFSSNIWVWVLARAVAMAVVFVALRAALSKAAAAVAASDRSETFGEAAWTEAAAGLRLFASALVVRVIAAFGCTLLLVLAVGVRSYGMLKLATVCIPVAATVTGAVMCVGLYRTLVAPAATEVQGRIGAALALWVTATVISVYGVLVIVDALRGWLPEDAAQLGRLDLAIVVMATVSFVLALSAATHLAERIGRVDLARRARLLIPVAVATLGGAAWMQRAALGVAGTREGALVFLLIAGVATVITTLAIAKLFHRLSDALREAPNPAPARVVRRP
jgi:hypothetical protein